MATQSHPHGRRNVVSFTSTGSETASLSGSQRNWVATRENSDFKWQRARGVLGALEVTSEPFFDYRAELKKRCSSTPREHVFQDALEAWNELELRQGFIKACEGLPTEACCCGLIQNPDSCIKASVSILNDHWVKSVNKKLSERGFKIDIFLWNWQNASGKAETNIMLIRFLELSSYRLRRASKEGALQEDFSYKEEDDESVNETGTSGGKEVQSIEV